MLLPIVAVILVGLATALEAPSNAYITRASGSPLWAGLAGAVVAGAAVAVALAATRPRLAPDWWSAPPYIWLAGVYGALIVVLTGWATPKLGAGTALVVIVAAQVALGVALDHFGLIGLKPHAASWLRVAGVLVVVGGALMVSLG